MTIASTTSDSLAAPADADAEQLVAAPSRGVQFMSRRSDLRLVLRSRWPKRDPITGTREGYVEAGIFVAFSDGVFTVPEADADGQVELTDSLDGGSVRVNRDWLLEKLRGRVLEDGTRVAAHKLYGDMSEGFSEVPQHAPAPSETEHRRIVDLILCRNIGQLKAMLRQEHEGFSRTELIDVLQNAITQLEAGEPKPDEPKPKQR